MAKRIPVLIPVLLQAAGLTAGRIQGGTTLYGSKGANGVLKITLK
jgi:hypothetical protein